MADQLQQPVPVDQILKKLKTSQPAAATTLPDHIMTARPDAQPKQQAQPKPAVAKPTAPAAPTVKPVNDILAKLRTPQPVSVEDQVRSAAKQYGVDPELAWKVAHQESGFNPRAVSRAGARGVMQLMGATAARYGVNPNNVEENIAGGMRYLHDLIDRYDSTDKALAAYNWGEERVDEAIQKYGENWLAHAPEETQRYVGAITSTGYMDQRGASFTLPRIFGRRGMEPRIPYPEPEAQTPKTSGPFGRMIDSLRAIGSKAYQHSFWADEEGEMGRGILGRAGRERAQAWWEENVPWRNFNAATLAAFHDLVGLPGVAAVMTDPQGDLEAFQKAHPDWANDPELKKQAADLAKRALPEDSGAARGQQHGLERFEHLAMGSVLSQGSDPVNIAFMFFPVGKALKAVGMGTRAALYTRATMDGLFAYYAGKGALRQVFGDGGAIDQFEHGQIPEGFADLLDATISAGFGVMGAKGAIHQVRMGNSLGRMNRLATETYGRPWEELPLDQRDQIAQDVSEATAKYKDVIAEMSKAERQRDLAAYVKATEKLGASPEELKRLKKEARDGGLFMPKAAPEERISGMIDRYKELRAAEIRAREPELAKEAAEERAHNEILDFLFKDNPAKVKDTWQRWQAIQEGEARPVTLEAKAEAERTELARIREQLLKEVVDSEKRLSQKLHEEAARTDRERESMRSDLEASEQRHRDRIKQANENLRAASPVLQRKEAGKEAPETPKMQLPTEPKRPYEEPPTLLEGAPQRDERVIRDAVHPYVGEERYRLENLIGHVNDFLETRKRPTSDAEIREELERLAKEAEKEEYARTADMAEAEESRLAKERGWVFKGRRRGGEELDLTPDQQARLDAQHKRGQVDILNELKRALQDQTARLSEDVPTAPPEEAKRTQGVIDEVQKTIGKIEDTQREIVDELPEEARPDPDRDKAPATIPDEFLGHTVPVKTSRGYSVDIQYAILEAGAVQASHDTDMNPNPNYPARVQPRNREAAFSAAHRDEVAGNFDPARVAEDYSANHGAPVVGDDLFVESGNLRAIVMKLLYKLGLPKAQEYREWLAKNSERFGISPEAVGKLKNPVLVRIRRTSLGDMGKDRAEFARDANAPFEAQMSTVEQAKADAAAINSDILAMLHPSETGEIFTQENQPFIQKFFDQIIPPAARGGYMLADGNISQQGIRRIQNAIFAKAYPGAEGILEKLLDDPDNNIRNAARAMFAAAPKFAQVNDLIKSGTLRDLGLASDIAEATQKLSFLRESGQSVADYLKTGQMFGPDISPAAREILQIFNDYSRRPMLVADIFNAYADEAMRTGRTDQGSMFGVEEVGKDQILRGAIAHVAGGGLFPEEAGGKPEAAVAAASGPLEGGKSAEAIPTQVLPNVPQPGEAKSEEIASPAQEPVEKPVEALSPTPEPIGGKPAEKASDAAAVERLVGDYRKTLGEKNGKKKLAKALKENREGLKEAEELQGRLEKEGTAAIEDLYDESERADAKAAGLDTPEKQLEQAKKVNGDMLAAYRAHIEAIERLTGKVKGEKAQKVVKAEPTIGGKVVEPPPNLEVPKEGAPEERPSYGEKNKIVTKDRAEELRKRILNKGLGQSSAGVDPTILKDMVELMAYHVEAGLRKFAEVADRMLGDFGEWVRPYLQPAWDSLHGKPTEETKEVVDGIQKKAEEQQQMGLFGEEKPSERAGTTERGKAPDDYAGAKEREGTEPRPVGAPERERPRGDGGTGGAVRSGQAAGSRGRSAERDRAIRDVPEAKLAPAIERVTPPSWEDTDWKQVLKDAGLPTNARIPTRRLYRHISDKLIYTGQNAVADYALSELVDGSGGVVIGTSTGTGKTYMSNAVMRQLTEMQPESMKRVLVLTKNQDLIKDFKTVAKQFGNEVEDYPKSGIPQKDGIYISTYAGALGREGIAEFPWDFALVDESGEARRWWESRQGNLVKDLGNRAKKAMYLSATPYHNAVEVGYLTKLGLWKGSTFEDWVSQFGVKRNQSTGEWTGHSNPRRVEKLRQQLMERGQMIDWPRNMDGYHANFAVVPIEAGNYQKMSDAARAWRMVADYYRKRNSSKMVMAANGNAVTFIKHLVESFRLPQAVDLARQFLKQGYQVIVFSERRSPVDGLYDFVKQADRGYGGQIDKMMPRIEGFSDHLRKAFGDEIAVYTGETHGKERRQELDDFNAGKKKILFSTYGAGGIGVSMHDTVGNAPRVAIYLGPPWSGIAFDQAIGRPWRFGTMSNVTSVFLFSNTKPEVDLVSAKISPRMESLRAIVNGIKEDDPIVKGLRSVDKMLEYSHGREQKDKADSFFEKVDTKGFQSHKDIRVPDASEHFYQGMKIKKRVLPMDKSPGDKPPEKGGGGTLFYSNPVFDPDAWKKYIVKDLVELFSKKVDPALPEADRASGAASRVAEEFFGSKGFHEVAKEHLGTADAVSKFATILGHEASEEAMNTRGDPAPVIRETLENGRRWLETMPGAERSKEFVDTATRARRTITDKMLISGRGLIRKYARQAGQSELGDQLVGRILEYNSRQGEWAGPWMSRIEMVMKKYGINKKEDFEHVWDVIEGEDEARHPNFEQAVKEIRRLNNEIKEELVKKGVTVTAFSRLTGRPTNFPFPARNNPNYMPRIYDESVFQHGSKKREEIVGRIMQKEGVDRVEAERILDNRDNRETPLAGNIERARMQDIPGYEKTFPAYLKYLDGAAEVLARTEVFGQNREKLNGLIGPIDSREARQGINEIFDLLLARNHFQKGPASLVQFASDWTMILKMPFSAIKMLTHLYKPAVMTNTRSFIDGLAKTIMEYPEAYRAALEGGSVWQQGRVELMRQYGVESRLGNQILKLYGVPEMDVISRIVADQSARSYITKFALPELIVSPKSSYRRILRENFGLSESAINKAIQEKKWTKEDLNRAGNRASAKTQGTWDPTELPPAWRAVPKDGASQTLAALFRTSVMLKAYIYKNGVFHRDMLISEVRKGNWRPLIPFIMLAPAFGEVVQDLSELARGNPSRFKELTHSETYEPWNLTKRVISNIAFNTAANLATTMVEGFARYHERPKEALMRSVTGPFLGDMMTFAADLMQSMKDLADGNPEKLQKLWGGYAKQVSPLVRAGENLYGAAEQGQQEPEGIQGFTLEPTPQ